VTDAFLSIPVSLCTFIGGLYCCCCCCTCTLLSITLGIDALVAVTGNEGSRALVNIGGDSDGKLPIK